MAISSLNRLISSISSQKYPAFSLTKVIKLSSISEKYCDHLLNHTQNPEKTLIKIGAELNASCVSEVLRRFSTSKPQLGLRFFIWAGVQSNYRHSQFMYSFACNLLKIGRNPSRIRDVVEDFKVEGCVINVKLFKILLNLCKEARVCDDALWVLRKMEEFNCRPDSTMYNGVIGLFCEKGDYEMAVGLMREMEGRNLFPDMITYMSMLKCFCNAGQLEDACLLFKAMKSRGCAANLVAYSALLDGLCRSGHMDKALELLEEMENKGGDCAPNVISYTSVIQNLCEKGKSMEALSILERMGSFKCSPNRITVSVLVKGLCADGHIDEACKLVVRVGDEGHVPSGECYSCLVIGLLNIKRSEDAEKRFRWMLDNSLRPNGLACSIMLKDLCAKGRFIDAFHLFEDVEKKGFVLTIDSYIYSILLVGLRRQMNVAEVEKLSCLMAEKGIPVKTLLT
ncbi:hypothetical protein RND81_08G133600 [Saponaria officinalis]|uniref:Pentatricopeptide repeat-containing protein n=1 Tax=Saponaria officinalis TaxID=3572 RepID=A0AAW1J8C1_SAPOF